MKENISAVLNYTMCGNLLWQTREINSLLRSECLCAIPPNLYIEILSHKVMVSGGRGIKKWLGWGVGKPLDSGTRALTVMTGIRALIKEDPCSSPAPSTMWGGHSKKSAACNLVEGSYLNPIMLTCWSWTPRLEKCGKYIPMVYQLSVCSILLK